MAGGSQNSRAIRRAVAGLELSGGQVWPSHNMFLERECGQGLKARGLLVGILWFSFWHPSLSLLWALLAPPALVAFPVKEEEG